MKQNEAVALKEELFDIILETEGHVISATELITVISNYRDLFQSVNEAINKQCGAGVDAIDFDVVALKEGSFEIPIIVKKLVGGVAINAIGGIIANLFDPNKLKYKVPFGDGHLELTRQDIVDNSKSLESIANIAQTAVVSPNIRSLVMEYVGDGGNMERINLEKSRLVALSNYEMKELVSQDVFNNTTRLKVISPVLNGKNVHWRFETETGTPISAKMDDKDFLTKIEDEHVAFGIHDVLTVVMETTQTHEKNVTKPQYRITKVIEYPHYRKTSRAEQLKLPIE